MISFSDVHSLNILIEKSYLLYMQTVLPYMDYASFLQDCTTQALTLTGKIGDSAFHVIVTCTKGARLQTCLMIKYLKKIQQVYHMLLSLFKSNVHKCDNQPTMPQQLHYHVWQYSSFP